MMMFLSYRIFAMYLVLFWSVSDKTPESFILKTEERLRKKSGSYVKCANISGGMGRRGKKLIKKADLVVVVLGPDPRERDDFMLWWARILKNVFFVCPGSPADPAVHRFLTGFHLDCKTAFTTEFLPYDERGFLCRYHNPRYILPSETKARDEHVKRLCRRIIENLEVHGDICYNSMN